MPSSRTVDLEPTETLAGIELALRDGTLQASWFHPDAKRYQAKYRPVDSRWWTWTKQGTASSITVNGLDPNTSYVVQVKMIAGRHWSPWREVIVQPS